jgi:hypothetical protein
MRGKPLLSLVQFRDGLLDKFVNAAIRPALYVLSHKRFQLGT